MQLLNKRPESLIDVPMHYCPGCGHGIVHRVIAEVMDELDIRKRTIGIAPVGCAVFADVYFNCDMIQGPHGRGPAEATGIKRAKPDTIVFSYQGDGDLASIGMAEIVHAAIRSENITVIFINNAIYGMTGGQQAPTTMPGQKTTTNPAGRDPKLAGYPIRVCEMLATLDGPAYIERVSVHNVANVLKAKRAIKKAFKTQNDGLGFSLVEVVSPCPTGWNLTPLKACEYVDKVMIPYYPLGVYKDITQSKSDISDSKKVLDKESVEK
ncbi:MAG TPA: 2-oxoglutarate oxidoreductase [Elusimicrobia bacterium]|nr:2-oxoglutarate oxidoreductase [Elusimicrobiota bacterium]